MTAKRAGMALVVAAILSGCGGAPATEQLEVVGDGYVELSATTAAAVSTLTYQGFTTAGAPRAGSAGSLTHDTGVITGGLLAGTINTARTSVALDDGGTAELTNPASTEYHRAFATQPTSGTPVVGVVGVRTDPGDLPGGTATTTGTASIAITDGGDFYELTGTARVDANFGDGSVDVTLSNLAGTRRTGASDTSVGNQGTLRIVDNTISGSGFSGGAASFSGSFSLSGGADSSDSRGAFYGPAAEEAGGVVVIDDTGSGGIAVLGTYFTD